MAPTPACHATRRCADEPLDAFLCSGTGTMMLGDPNDATAGVSAQGLATGRLSTGPVAQGPISTRPVSGRRTLIDDHPHRFDAGKSFLDFDNASSARRF